MNFSRSIIIAGISGAIAVALGALGAHWLKNQISGGLITADQVIGFDTGVKYQMYHTLSILLVVLLSRFLNSRYLKWSFNFFLAGIVLFSGSLYFLTTRNLYGADFLKALGPVTPLGGLCFIAGWLLLVIAAVKKKDLSSQ